jgi:hypothetical protein
MWGFVATGRAISFPLNHFTNSWLARAPKFKRKALSNVLDGIIIRDKNRAIVLGG